MGVEYIAYLFAIAVGVVTSGAIVSLWAVLTDEAPSVVMLTNGSVFAPLKVPLVILGAPVTIMGSAFKWMFESPMLGVLLLILGIFWSFIQGVFILTQIFGVT